MAGFRLTVRRRELSVRWAQGASRAGLLRQVPRIRDGRRRAEGL
jgi:hypothetical protein